MAIRDVPYCRRSDWRGRPAWIVGNDLIQATVLTGGGHIAEFRFHASTGQASVNPLWEPSWETMDPSRYREARDAEVYGSSAVGRYLAGMAGHSVCVDYFGLPSEAEIRRGLTIHGEAAVRKWNVVDVSVRPRRACLRLSVELPLAGLEFIRELRIRAGEPVVYFRETVHNRNRTDHFFQWQQHVTLSASFLIPGRSRITIPSTRGKTWLDGYGAKALLEPGVEFTWPHAPARDRTTVDLHRPFVRRGTGFVAAARIDPTREDGFIAAVDHRDRLVFGYSFSRQDFPWVTVWEENRARRESPWNGQTLARGLEFGTSPFPGPRSESFSLGSVLDTPTLAMVPARGKRTVEYLAFLSPAPDGFTEVQEIERDHGQLRLFADGTDVRVPATGMNTHFREDARG